MIWEREMEGIRMEVGKGNVGGGGFRGKNSGVVDDNCHLDRML